MTTNNLDPDVLLQKFLIKPTPRSQQSVRDRMLHWRDVYSSPEKFTGDDQSPFAIAAKRKVAVQSLKKLIARNPEIAAVRPNPLRALGRRFYR